MVLPGHAADDEERGHQGGHAEPERPSLVRAPGLPQREADDDQGGQHDHHLGRGLRHVTEKARCELHDPADEPID